MLFILMLMSSSAFAQITMTKSDFASWTPTVDSLAKLDDSQPYPSIPEATNSTWDFSNAVYKTTKYTHQRFSYTSPIDSNISFGDSTRYQLNPNLYYEAVMLAGIIDFGVYYYGEHIGHRSIPIGSFTGGANDSLVFLEQDIEYSNPFKSIVFPATMGSNWESEYNFSTNFTLSIAAYSLNNVPCQRKSKVVKTDSVVGWGQMLVKNRAGQHSPAIDVLMVKSYYSISDSFFMNGTPAPTALLTAFGISQGMITNRYEYLFYQEGEIAPIVFTEYGDNSFSTNNVVEMNVNVNHWIPTTIKDITLMGCSLFPNPIQNHTINIATKNPIQNSIQWNLVNMFGQSFGKGVISLSNQKASIGIHPSVPSGMYYLQLSNPSQTSSSLPLIIK